ncbi:MAG: thiolase family protein [Caulobacterales bacterium]
MIDTPEKRSIISGIGLSRTGRKTGISSLELTLESSRQAIADAGLTPADIDGIATMGETPLQDVIAALELEPGYRGGGFDTGGLLSPVISAFFAAGAGKARHILVYRTVQMMGGSVLPPRNADSSAAEAPPRRDNAMTDMRYLLPYHGYAAPNWLGMHCQRHMHLYGTKKEQLGWLAVNSRRNAGLNPGAVYRDPFTLDDYMNARMISTPFGLLDCDVPIDGSVAVVVSTADYAKDCPRAPIYVESIGGSNGDGGWFRRADYPKMASVDAAAELWGRTDLKPKNIDFAQLYDGFTFLTFAWLEALGICGEGEAGPFVDRATRIALEGEMPLNTYGGQLSAGRMHGYWILHEACLQLRREAGPRQIRKAANVAVVAAGGGPIAGCMLLRV